MHHLATPLAYLKGRNVCENKFSLNLPNIANSKGFAELNFANEQISDKKKQSKYNRKERVNKNGYSVITKVKHLRDIKRAVPKEPKAINLD